MDKKKEGEKERKWEHVRSPFTALARFNHLSFIEHKISIFLSLSLFLAAFFMFFVLKICKSCFYFIIDRQMLTVYVYSMHLCAHTLILIELPFFNLVLLPYFYYCISLALPSTSFSISPNKLLFGFAWTSILLISINCHSHLYGIQWQPCNECGTCVQLNVLNWCLEFY